MSVLVLAIFLGQILDQLDLKPKRGSQYENVFSQKILITGQIIIICYCIYPCSSGGRSHITRGTHLPVDVSAIRPPVAMVTWKRPGDGVRIVFK